jgi:hypothetical protein
MLARRLPGILLPLTLPSRSCGALADLEASAMTLQAYLEERGLD